MISITYVVRPDTKMLCRSYLVTWQTGQQVDIPDRIRMIKATTAFIVRILHRQERLQERFMY